jgi:hypothetical protein
MRPSNIREFVWKIIETDLALKKDLSRGVINVRGLAQYIKDSHKVDLSLDAIISAIRRYQVQPAKKVEAGKVYSLLKQAKISTITKISSLSLRKNDDVHLRIGELLPKDDYTRGEILRVIEGARIFRLIFDQKNLEAMRASFGKKNIVEVHKKLGMLEILYPDILLKTPGVFNALSTELAEHDISIVDALICANEHIIVVEEKDVQKAFDVVFTLCN